MSIKAEIAIQTDLELLSSYRTGRDMEALGELWARHAGMLFGVAMKYLKEKESAQDACGELFLEITEKVLRHEVSQVRPWLYVLMKNHCLQRIRKSSGREMESIDEIKIERVHVENPDFEHLNSKEDDEARLTAALDQLNAEQSTCLRLFYFQEKSYKEIAEECGMDIGKVKSYIQNGKRNLQIALRGRT